MPGIFISYARDDDEPFVRQLYHDLTSQGFDVWWDRKAMESRGLSFPQEIRDAIVAVDRLVLVVGPRAVEREYVRFEWRHALEFCTVVLPILRLGDRSSIPDELAKLKLHCPDVRATRPYEEALEELTRLLAEPVLPLGPLAGVPSLPPHFVPRDDDLDRLRATVLADVIQPTIITSARRTTILQGMGGVGKSVLAAAFVHACETRRSFGDGAIWITIGQQPDLAGRLAATGAALGDDGRGFVDPEQGQVRLAELLADEACLLVLDDVWDVRHAEVFRNALGPRCRLLVTTRDGALATALGGQEVPLDILTERAALQLLADWSEQPVAALPLEARTVADECGYLPFALALAGAMARDGNQWSDLLDALRDADLTFLENRFPDYPYPNVLRALKVSVDALAATDPEAVRRYLELVVFPADQPIPEAAVLTLWTRAGDLSERSARRLFTVLDRKSLLRLDGDAPNRSVSLHDLQYDYLRAVGGDTPELHAALLDAYSKQCPAGWPSGPNDGYFFEHLAYHLVQAGRGEDLRALLLDSRWLRTKLAASGVAALIADYDLVEGNDHSLIQEALRLSAHTLADDSGQLPSQLWTRLGPHVRPSSAIRSLLDDVRHEARAPWLQPLTTTLTPAGTPLVRTLRANMNSINGVAVSADETLAVCGDDDATIHIWDLASGIRRHTIDAEADWITCCATHPDAPIAIVGGGDGQVLFIDLHAGAIFARRVIDAGRVERSEDGVLVNAVVFSPDGQFACSAHDDGIVRIYDAGTGNLMHETDLDGTDVKTATFSVDSRSVYLAAGSIERWDITLQQRLDVLEPSRDGVESLAISGDGRYLAAGYHDGAIDVWDLDAQAAPMALPGHRALQNRNIVTALAFLPDQPDHRRLVSVAWDETLRIWSIPDAAEVSCIEAHSTSVYDVALFGAGRFAITASKDGMLKVWDLERIGAVVSAPKHAAAVDALAVSTESGIVVSGSRDRTLRIWNLITVDVHRTIDAHAGTEPHEGWVQDVALTPDHQTIVSTSKDGTIRTWDLETGQETSRISDDWDAGTSLVLAADGTIAVACEPSYTDRPLAVWRIGPPHERWFTRRINGNAVAVSRDGSLVVVSDFSGTLQVMDVRKRRVLRRLQSAHFGEDDQGYVTSISLTDDGSLAVTGHRDGWVEVWDLNAEISIAALPIHREYVSAVAVSRDGSIACTASWDYTLRLWEIPSGNVIATFYGDEFWASCRMTDDMRTIVAGDEAGNVHILAVRQPDGLSDSGDSDR